MNKKTKTQIQEETLLASTHAKHLLVTNATGTGKTLTAIKIAEEKSTDKLTLILIKEKLHKNNWIAEFKKHGYSLDNYVFACYASAHKYEGKSFNLILDEVHALSDARLESLKTINSDFIISLSATVTRTIKERLNNLYPFKEYHLSTSEAIEYGILPEPKIFIVDCWLGRERNLVYTKTKGKDGEVHEVSFKDRFKTLIKLKSVKNYIVNILCNEQEYYVLLTEDMEYFKKLYYRTRTEIFKTKWLNKGSERKRFIANCKTRYLVDIISKLDGRFICFCGSVKQANDIGDNVIHNEISEKTRERLVSDFNERKIDHLYTVEMLKEGMNLTDCKYGLITQLDNFELSFIQKLGRVLRHEKPVVFIFLMRNTQDEKYFDNVFENFDTKYLYKLDESWRKQIL